MVINPLICTLLPMGSDMLCEPFLLPQEFAAEINAFHLETSAKTAVGISELFDSLGILFASLLFILIQVSPAC